jgi:hypothetical protein
MADLLTYSMRSTFAKEFYQSLIDPVSDDRYYMFYGRAKPWDGNTPILKDTIKEQNEAKRNTLFYQQIIPSDVSLVAPRYNWTSGEIYDQYEDDEELWKDNKKFYVLVQDVEQYSVYLCLSNNGGVASTDVPSGTDTEEIFTSDGYIWKYLYTLTNEMEQFLTNTYIPVVILDKLVYTDERATALNVKANASNGTIEKISVDTKAIFTNLVNNNFSSNTYQVLTTDTDNSLSFDVSLLSQHSSTSNFYNTNYIVYFQNGKVGTVDTYTINGDGTATITLCEIYPDDGNNIQPGDVYSILPKVNIVGNGTGAVSIPVFDGNSELQEITVISGGSGYNFAEAFFYVQTSAVLSAIIPPDGGHGFEFVGELKPTNILIKKQTTFSAIPDDEEKYFGAGSYVRQYGIIKNIKTTTDQNPDVINNEYDMILKYDGEQIDGTLYGSKNQYTLPFYRHFVLCDISNVTNGQYQNFYKIGHDFECPDSSSPSKNWEGTLFKKEIVEQNPDTTLKCNFYFLQKSNTGVIKYNPIFKNITLNTTIPQTNLNRLVVYLDLLQNITDAEVYAYLSIGNYDINEGKLIGAFNFFYPTDTTYKFNEGDVIDIFSGDLILGRYKISKIITPGYVSAAPFSGGTITPYNSTTFELECLNIYNDILTDPNLTYTPDYINNITQNNSFDLVGGGNLFFSNPTNYLFFKDITQKLDLEFDSSNIVFSSVSSAPETAPTHILGNDTLAISKIKSLSVDPNDSSKFNMKILSPTEDYEQATISDGNVISGEAVTLLRQETYNGFTNKFTKIGETKNLYVLSENYDVSSPANIPDTITSSVVSKITLNRTGSVILNNQIIPVGSYLYRESTETVDSASGYVVSIDTSSSSGGNATNYAYVQMEKGTFIAGDIIKCVLNPFVKNITLFNNTCAGNAGVVVTVSAPEQRFNSLFLNKYSGEVLYIQNTDPIQMATDTNFTTRILLGF